MFTLAHTVEGNAPPLRQPMNPFHCPAPPPPPPVVVESGQSVGGSLFQLQRRRTIVKPGGATGTLVGSVEPQSKGRPSTVKGPPRQGGGSVIGEAVVLGGGLTSTTAAPPATTITVNHERLLYTGSSGRLVSRLIPGREYYGGIYYAPPASITLDRTLTEMQRQVFKDKHAWAARSASALPAPRSPAANSALTVPSTDVSAAATNGGGLSSTNAKKDGRSQVLSSSNGRLAEPLSVWSTPAVRAPSADVPLPQQSNHGGDDLSFTALTTASNADGAIQRRTSFLTAAGGGGATTAATAVGVTPCPIGPNRRLQSTSGCSSARKATPNRHVTVALPTDAL